ncbi:ferulic acid esterase [Cristinia sonorae]|uniref:Carboxylic ester hydrolase n=1 Tax=Cristinia sonorae TaxID=1940300 RepID=A0A8K0XQ98_9AGAR|nr:ferulic acid esterase [Cristinia sonorae]
MLQDVLGWATQLLNATLPFLGWDQSGALPFTTHEDFAAHCVSFASTSSIPGGALHFSHYVPAGTNLTLPDNHPSCGVSSWVVSSDICRIALSVSTSETSEISLEAWFPYDYTGRFLTTTNRGLGGCILYNEADYASSLGFAAVGMNTGFNGSSADPMLNNPNAIEDYSYRSVHTGTVSGKALAAKFYGAPSRNSYYLGCSSGGRQGFKEAQEFPDDFDGILAGAPAIAFTQIVSWGGYLYRQVSAPDSFLSPELWAVVYDEVLRQCDKLDGAADGLLENPDMCNFTPEVLICTKSQKKDCLTPKQAAAVRGVFSPFYGTKGELVYPRMQPGINTRRLEPFYLNGEPSFLTLDWFRNVVYNDTTWDGKSFSVDDAAAAIAQNPLNVETWNGDLSPFAARGGKLLSYHGTQDWVISSQISQLYYAHVAQSMGKPPAELDEFYRLFMVSGMDHCKDGDGAWAIGQDKDAYAGTGADDNVLMALVRWVEEGVPPEVLRGAKFEEDGVTPEYWRAHCRWPKRNRYVGPGAFTDEGGWECQ